MFILHHTCIVNHSGLLGGYMSTTNPVFQLTYEEWFWQYGWKTYLFFGLIAIILLWWFYDFVKWALTYTKDK